MKHSFVGFGPNMAMTISPVKLRMNAAHLAVIVDVVGCAGRVYKFPTTDFAGPL